MSAGVQPNSLLSEDRQSPPLTDAASPLHPQPAPSSPQPTTPHSALLPSPSPPASPFTLPRSPLASPFRAGSLEAPPSSHHRTALLQSSSPYTPPPPSLGVCQEEEELTNQQQADIGVGAKSVLEDKPISCHVTLADTDSQLRSQIQPVAVATEATKDEHQSHTEPSEKEEEPPETLVRAPKAASPEMVSRQQPMSEKQNAEQEESGSGATGGWDEEEVQDTSEQEDQFDVDEEEPVSPVMELDPSLDMEVMELMTSCPPPSLVQLSSPSPPPFSRRGKGRTLRPSPCSSRPLDDLSIRLRQSPFSTEASPETSPTRAPITPPPLSPPSPPLRSSPSTRESPPLYKVRHG